MTCPHDRNVTQWRDNGRIVMQRCECGEWLGLGPSNDDGEAVAIEVLAAMVAAEPFDDDRLSVFDDHPVYGHVAHLARCIATTEEP